MGRDGRYSERGFQMFARMIDDFKESTGSALRLTSLAAAAALALLVTTAFLCAAAFVLVLDKYGLVQACFAGAAVFFVVSLIAAFSYIARKKQIEKQARARAQEAARSAAHSVLADPMLVAAGLQVIRAIGVKRLIPILAVGGIALGFLASRSAAVGDEAPAE
jgi:fatty acid desaturase